MRQPTLPEGLLVSQLQIFAISWTLEAMLHVCVVKGEEVAELHSGLVDIGLILPLDSITEPRYTLSQDLSMANFPADTRDAPRRRHADYFLSLAETSHPLLNGPDQTAWLDRLTADHANILAAMHHCLEDDDPSRLLRFCGALQRFWWKRGHLEEGKTCCNLALNRPGADKPSVERVRTLNGAGVIAKELGDLNSARTLLEECLAISQKLADPRLTASAYNNLGNVAYQSGDFQRALDYHRVSLAIKREIGDSISGSLGNMGIAAECLGDFKAAQQYQIESLNLRVAANDMHGILLSLENLGYLSARLGDANLAATLLGKAEAMRESLGSPLPTSDVTEYTDVVTLVRSKIGNSDEFDRLWSVGREMNIDSVIELATN
ncbi:MAG: tetratricopeptide repeat protein [Chthonomonadales bacterium]